MKHFFIFIHMVVFFIGVIIACGFYTTMTHNYDMIYERYDCLSYNAQFINTNFAALATPDSRRTITNLYCPDIYDYEQYNIN